jgi:hypothetical protein
MDGDRPKLRRAISPKGQNSEKPLFRKAIRAKGLYSEKLFFDSIHSEDICRYIKDSSQSSVKLV